MIHKLLGLLLRQWNGLMNILYHTAEVPHAVSYAYDINNKWDQLMSPPTLKIMDENFIASYTA